MKAAFYFLTVFLIAAPAARAKDNLLTLGKLTIDKDFESGCGCSVRNSKGDFLVFSELNEKSPAVIRVGGQRRELKLVASSPKPLLPKVGSKFAREYAEGSFTLRLDYEATAVCKKTDEACEVTHYTVDAHLSDGTRKSEMKFLKGDCGC